MTTTLETRAAPRPVSPLERRYVLSAETLALTGPRSARVFPRTVKRTREMGIRDKLKSRLQAPVERIANLAVFACVLAVIALIVAVSHAR